MRLIHRRPCWTAFALAIGATASPARGQRPHLTPREIAQIANEALRIVVPAESAFSGVSVAKRGIAIDVRGTLATRRCS